MDGGRVLPALEESADEDGAGVDERRPSEPAGDGPIEGERPPLGEGGTRTQLGELVDAPHVTDVERAVDPAERVTSQHRRMGTCRAENQVSN